MTTIVSFLTPYQLPYQQIIIAGSDEDVSTGDLLEWVYPVLAGIPNGRWSSCELEFDSQSEVFARYRSGNSSIELNLSTGWTAEDIANASAAASETCQANPRTIIITKMNPDVASN